MYLASTKCYEVEPVIIKTFKFPNNASHLARERQHFVKKSNKAPYFSWLSAGFKLASNYQVFLIIPSDLS